MIRILSLIFLSLLTISAFGMDNKQSHQTSQSLNFKHYILISAPGSGKGTFSQYLVEKYGYVQICPGDIFRNEIRLQTELGKKIQSIVEKGDYVDKSTVCHLMAHHISKTIENKRFFILDGFPRAEISFQFLHDFLRKNNLTKSVCFLQFPVADEICTNRILTRQICTGCFKVYSSSQSSQQNKCSNCGTVLTQRKADTKEIANKRLTYFHTHIEPLMQKANKFYETKKIKTDCSLKDLKEKYDNLFK